MKKCVKTTPTLQYRVELVSHKVDSLTEKTFCFWCGCFQGGLPVEKD